MPNYRRLISYIYAYEGGIKGKNTGYAKLEVRGDQCRVQVNVKKVFVGSNDIGVYLLERSSSAEAAVNSVQMFPPPMWNPAAMGLTSATVSPSMTWEAPGRATPPSGRMRWPRQPRSSWNT